MHTTELYAYVADIFHMTRKERRRTTESGCDIQYKNFVRQSLRVLRRLGLATPAFKRNKLMRGRVTLSEAGHDFYSQHFSTSPPSEIDGRVLRTQR